MYPRKKKKKKKKKCCFVWGSVALMIFIFRLYRPKSVWSNEVFWFFDMLKYIYSESSFNTQYIDVMLKC